MAEQSGGEKSLPASPLRKQRAREEGQVARSQDLSAAGALLVALFALRFLGPMTFNRLMLILRHFLEDPGQYIPALDNMQQLTIEVVWLTLPALAPFMLVMLLAGVALNILQVGFLLTTKPLMPRLEKLNPISGFGNLFSTRAFVELIKSLLKVTLISYVVWLTLRGKMDMILALMDLTPAALIPAVGALVFTLWWRIALVMLILGILDFGFQYWQRERDLRMTRQEATEEAKEFEGDPRIKARIRQIQRQVAMQRMLKDVPTAEVVITNPTHFAVALRYDVANMAAPVVIAKGALLLAQRIRDIAVEHDVPIVEDRELARTLYRTIDVGHPVPETLFRAVAEVLGYVYKIDRREEKLRERKNLWSGKPLKQVG